MSHSVCRHERVCTRKVIQENILLSCGARMPSDVCRIRDVKEDRQKNGVCKKEQDSREQVTGKQAGKKGRDGALGGDRTHNPCLRRAVLYPLSYERAVMKSLSGCHEPIRKTTQAVFYLICLVWYAVSAKKFAKTAVRVRSCRCGRVAGFWRNIS